MKEEKYYAYQIFDINDLDKEVWKDIKGYEGKYQVSNCGRIKSLNYHLSGKPQILKQAFTKDGYLQIQLNKDGKGKNFRVNRLTAFSFIDNPNNYPCVNHKDENKVNNIVENLEFCTQAYNNKYGTRILRASKTNSISIVQIDPVTKCGRKWESSAQAKKEGGFNKSSIIQCCKNKHNREGNNIHKGYKWGYFQPPAIYKG